MKNKLIVYIIVALVIGGGAGFFGGINYQKTKDPRMMGFYGNSTNQRGTGQFRGNNGMRPILGQITSKDESTMTLKGQDGSSRIIVFSAKTAFSKTATAAASDLAIGKQVLVFGALNTDGSMTAQNVQLDPSMRVFGRQAQQ